MIMSSITNIFSLLTGNVNSLSSHKSATINPLFEPVVVESVEMPDAVITPVYNANASIAPKLIDAANADSIITPIYNPDRINELI